MDEPSQDNRNLRDWAIQVIDRYSGVPLSDSAKAELLRRTFISEQGILSEPGILPSKPSTENDSVDNKK